MPRYHRVFISHAHADNTICKEYADALRAKGIDVWIDLTNAQQGHDLGEEIGRELRERSAFLLMVTADSNRSHWVRQELGAYNELKNTDATHCVNGVERMILPVRLNDDVPTMFNYVLWVDALNQPLAPIVDRIVAALVIAPVSTDQHDPVPPFPPSLTSQNTLTQEPHRDVAGTTLRRPADVSLSPYDRQNRANFLDKVFDIWIAGFLERSLEQNIWVELGLEDRDDLLPNPWRIVMQETEAVAEPLPPGVTVEQVYDQTRQRQLLIIGEPGSGKTTQMLHLARHLVACAKQDERQPIPAIFNLSSWAHRQLSLMAWLVEELRIRYGVSVDTGQRWVEEGRLLPLLDGLDEVSDERRAACARAINSYLDMGLKPGQGASPVVICCRSEEYQAMVPHLTVQRAIRLLPLSAEQIDDYFKTWKERGADVDTLWQAVRDDRELRFLARQPLMLSVFILAYQGVGKEALPLGQTSVDEVLRQVWNAYVDRMLHRRKPLAPWTERQARAWLTVLAQQMRRHGETLFGLEQLQTDWLATLSRWTFLGFVGMLVAVLVGVISSIAFGAGGGVLIGIIFGIIGLVLVSIEEINPVEKLGWDWSKFRFAMPAGIIVGSAFGLLASILVGNPLRTLLMGMVSGAFFGLINGVEKAHIIERRVLRPAEGIRRSGVSGVIVGLVSGLVVGTLVYAFGGLTFGVLSGLTFGVLSGAEKVLRGRKHIGLRSVLLAALAGLVFGAVGAVTFGVFINTLKGVRGSILAGGVFGLFFGMLDGGDAFLLHYFLHLWLWISGSIPRRFVAFLDEMGERLLLRRIGGNYVFAHRLLLDHFANGYTRISRGETSTPAYIGSDHRLE